MAFICKAVLIQQTKTCRSIPKRKEEAANDPILGKSIGRKLRTFFNAKKNLWKKPSKAVRKFFKK